MSPCQVRNAIKRAFRVWEEVVQLDFVETEDNADMIIYFGYSKLTDLHVVSFSFTSVR